MYERELVQGIGQVGGEVWRPYAQQSAKRRVEVMRWVETVCDRSETVEALDPVPATRIYV